MFQNLYFVANTVSKQIMEDMMNRTGMKERKLVNYI